ALGLAESAEARGVGAAGVDAVPGERARLVEGAAVDEDQRQVEGGGGGDQVVAGDGHDSAELGLGLGEPAEGPQAGARENAGEADVAGVVGGLAVPAGAAGVAETGPGV